MIVAFMAVVVVMLAAGVRAAMGALAVPHETCREVRHDLALYHAGE